MVSFQWLNSEFPLDWIAQTTVCLLLGILASFIWANRPARAHRVLLLAMLAAAITPLASQIVRRCNLGLIGRASAVSRADQAPNSSAPTRTTEATSAAGADFDDRQLARGFPFIRGHSPIKADAVAAPPSGSTAATLPWTTIFVSAWAMLSTVLTARLILAIIQSTLLLRNARPLADARIERAVATALARLGIQTNPVVCMSDSVRCPVIWCWSRRPILLLPSSATDATALDWEGILCHELAHWMRRDHLTGLFAELMVCGLPWQPLAWWSKRALSQLSERACDDWALASGQSAATYAESLLSLLPQRRAALTLAAVTSKSHLLIRVRHILACQPRDPRTGTLWLSTALLGTLVLVTAVAFAQTRTTPQQPTAEPPVFAPQNSETEAPPLNRTQAVSAEAASTVVNRKLWGADWIQAFSTVSPDGRFVTYMDRQGFITSHDLVTGEDRRITPKGFGTGYPADNAFSPDGKQLAYVATDRQGELRIVDTDGSNDRLLYKNEEVSYPAPCAWTIDGKHVIARFGRKDRTAQIALVAVADGTVTVLKSFPDWRIPENIFLSPDGKFLAYNVRQRAGEGSREIMALAIDGTSENTVTVGGRLFGWSPDSKQVVYAYGSSDADNVWLRSVTDGKAVGEPVSVHASIPRSYFSESNKPLGVAKNGSAYYAYSIGPNEAYVAAFDNTTNDVASTPLPAAKLYGIDQPISHFDWSPDGQKLVYQPVRERNSLIVRSLASGSERTLKPELERATLRPEYDQVRWSSDGRSLITSAVTSGDRGKTILWIDAETGEVKDRKTFPWVTAQMAQWSDDGARVYLLKGGNGPDNDRFLAHHVASGENQELFHLDEPLRFRLMRLSPDGQQMAFVSGGRSLMIAPTAGGQPREVTRLEEGAFLRGYSETLAWSRDSRHLLFVKSKGTWGDPDELWRVAVDGGEPQKLNVTLLGPTHHVRIHPDGNQISFMVEQFKMEFWVLESLWPAGK